ncbi:hypothetical protein DVH05_000308 [Phytophthora capsici]|nr:hypothetical protein DVH05_000308 [Phytophthora capsici]
MTTLLSDEAFLAQVDQFLTSCDTPLQPVKDTASIKKETMQSPQISIKSKPKRTNALVIKREFERAKDRKRRQVYRDRRRLERDSLRLEVSKLSETLCRVQQVKEQKPSLASIAWKAVAKNQFEALKAARAQQEALKSAVETRFQLIQEFGGFITELCKDVENVPSNGHKPVEIGPTDTLIFETFLQEIDEVYVGTKSVSEESDVDSPSSWAFDASTGNFGFTDRRFMAFDFQLASQQMWQRAHTLAKEDRVFYHLHDPSDTVAVKFRISRRLNCGQLVSVVQCMVGRRYRENNRLVVVWRAFTEGEGLFDGSHSDETGWCIVEPSTVSDKPGTLLSLRIQHKPIHVGSAQEKEVVMEQFSRLLCTTGTEDFVEIVGSMNDFTFE